MPAKSPDQIVLVRKGMNKGGLIVEKFTSMSAASQYMLKYMYERGTLDAVVQGLNRDVLIALKEFVNMRLNEAI